MSAHTVKVCVRCGASKTVRCFYRHKTAADGYRSTCKECHTKEVNENRALKRDHYLAWRRAHRAKPEVRAHENALRRAWRATSRGKHIDGEHTRIWRALNPERYAAIQQRYIEKRKAAQA
jgi:hypothetical protein